MNFNFEDSPGYHINRAAAKMRNSLQRAFREQYKDITVDYWVILNRLWIEDGMIQKELAELTAKDNASMTRILDGMQKNGLLERKPDSNDRRAFRIFLTEKGRSLEIPLKKIASENTGKGFRNVNREEMELLKKVLKKISDSY